MLTKERRAEASITERVTIEHVEVGWMAGFTFANRHERAEGLPAERNMIFETWVLARRDSAEPPILPVERLPRRMRCNSFFLFREQWREDFNDMEDAPPWSGYKYHTEPVRPSWFERLIAYPFLHEREFTAVLYWLIGLLVGFGLVWQVGLWWGWWKV